MIFTNSNDLAKISLLLSLYYYITCGTAHEPRRETLCLLTLRLDKTKTSLLRNKDWLDY